MIVILHYFLTLYPNLVSRPTLSYDGAASSPILTGKQPPELKQGKQPMMEIAK